MIWVFALKTSHLILYEMKQNNALEPRNLVKLLHKRRGGRMVTWINWGEPEEADGLRNDNDIYWAHNVVRCVYRCLMFLTIRRTLWARFYHLHFKWQNFRMRSNFILKVTKWDVRADLFSTTTVSALLPKTCSESEFVLSKLLLLGTICTQAFYSYWLRAFKSQKLACKGNQEIPSQLWQKPAQWSRRIPSSNSQQEAQLFI